MAVRPELDELRARVAATLDEGRPAATERRHAGGRRTARENIEDLCDPGSFEEYGGLVIAAQRARRSTEDLVANTPADGLVAGIGRVNGDLFDRDRSRCAVLSYDYSVLAGTQGQMNHRKKDRLFELVERLRLPVVLFAEGGGGRPGDTDMAVVTGLDTEAFALFGALSGKVPLVGVVSGRCFAGNAALLGCCHVIIATPDANIGMGGPAMIEGGGLGVYRPEDIGPVSVQVPNGVVDVLCADETEAVEVARRYLVVLPGRRAGVDGAGSGRACGTWSRGPAARVRHPAGDRPAGRRGVGPGAAAVVRPGHGDGAGPGGGAGDRRHRQQPDAPGGRHRRRQRRQGGALPAAVRGLRPARPLACATRRASWSVPRPRRRRWCATSAACSSWGRRSRCRSPASSRAKAYGLGAQAMAGGSFRRPLFTVAWPTGELGGMGLEGAVRLGFRRELDRIDDPDERAAAFDAMVARAYEHGKAVHVAEHFEIDDVIDPARDEAAPRARPRGGGTGGGGWRRRPSALRGHVVMADDSGRTHDDS